MVSGSERKSMALSGNMYKYSVTRTEVDRGEVMNLYNCGGYNLPSNPSRDLTRECREYGMQSDLLAPRPLVPRVPMKESGALGCQENGGRRSSTRELQAKVVAV